MHDGGGSGQQFVKQLRRKIGPQPNLLGENAILFGAFDETGEAFLGKARAAILGYAARDLAIAAAHHTSVTASPSTPRAEIACRCA
jgi:hypothetical protein